MGLKQNDLDQMVYDIVTIDEYSSKMGKDENISTLCFSIKQESPANDLSLFLEKGYKFILDSDVSPGEVLDSKYMVFVELERNDNLIENILTILDDVKKLANIEQFKFRYYKQFRSMDATFNNMLNVVPTAPENYGINLRNTNNSYFEFFDKSALDDIIIKENTIHFRKNRNTISFNILDFGKIEEIQHHLTERFNIMESYPEILYLTKYIGDYNISIYGNKYVFENKSNFLILEK